MNNSIKFIALIATVMLISCTQPADNTEISSENKKLVVTGSSTIAPLVTELARRFELANPGTRVDVQTGGSSRGISDVRRNISDIGMVSRKIKSTENDIHAHLIARDGVSLIVHSSNPLTELNEQQIKAIYRGELNNWESLTGHKLPVMVISKAEGRSTLEVFLDYFSLKNSDIKADAIIGDNEQAIKLVENNPAAIAYVSIGTAEYDIANGSKIKTLALDGISATTKNVANNSFPLSRELNLITTDSSNPLAQKFLAYALSENSHSVIKEFGFVPTISR